jgi:Cys-rich repeat protein
MSHSTSRFTNLILAAALSLGLIGALHQLGCCLQPGAERPDASTTSADAGRDADRDGGLPWIYCDADAGCPSGTYCKSLLLSACLYGSFVAGQQPYWRAHCVSDCSDGSCSCASDGDCPPPLRCNHGSCGALGFQPVIYCPAPCSVTAGAQGLGFCLCPNACPGFCLQDSDCPSGNYCDLTYGPCLDGGAAGICHRDCTQGDLCNPAGCVADECGCVADYECPPGGACVDNPNAGSAQCEPVDAGPCPEVSPGC